jgi:hypothetical protein
MILAVTIIIVALLFVAWVLADGEPPSFGK